MKDETYWLKFHQFWIFFFTFFSYSALHASRQAFSNAKSNLEDDWNMKKQLEGGMDATFLFAYAVGLYCSGIIGDKFDATKLQTIALIGTAIVIAIFGASYSHLNIKASNTAYFILIWLVNGLIQSLGWPTSVKIMGNWFGSNHSGFIFGMWSANACVGNIIGIEMVNYVTSNNLNIEWAFYLPSLFMAFIGICIFFFVRTDPAQRDLPDPTHRYDKEEQILHSERTRLNINNAATTNTGAATMTNDINNDPNLIEINNTQQTASLVSDGAVANMANSNNNNNNNNHIQTGSISDAYSAQIDFDYDMNETFGDELDNPRKKQAREARQQYKKNSLHTIQTMKNLTDLSDFNVIETLENAQHSSRIIGNLNENKHVHLKHRKITFKEALFIPNVLNYALCYACLKSVNYTMFFWLPYYLDTNSNHNESINNQLSMLYDVGQIFGGWACGYISDYLRKRSPSVFAFLIIAMIPIFLFRIKSDSIVFLAILSTASGFFVGGPANMISSAISADLGKHKSLKGNPEALATVAGIVDGTGSFGAAATQYIVSVISDYGWELVFVVLTVLLLASALLIVKLFITEMKIICRYGRKTSDEIESGFGIGQGYGDIESDSSGDSNILSNCFCCRCCSANSKHSRHIVRVQRESFSEFQS